MKLTIVIFLSFLFAVLQLKKKNLDVKQFIKKLMQCKACEEMFDFDFNYDGFMQSPKMKVFEKAFDPIFETADEKKIFFSWNPIEDMVKEISMRYFFRGGEEKFDNEMRKLEKCKNRDKELKEECSKMQLDQCEHILGFEKNICIEVNSHMRQCLSEQFFNKIPNLKQTHSEQKTKLEEISLLEVSPQRSIVDSHHPVLLKNVGPGIGDQLNEISFLSSEILKTEREVKQIKNKLANKLEVMQSSYSIVQKTLSEISKVVNIPNIPSGIDTHSIRK